MNAPYRLRRDIYDLPVWQRAIETEHARRPERPDYHDGRAGDLGNRILAACDDVSDEFITVLLLGAARYEFAPTRESNVGPLMAKYAFGERAADLISAMRCDPFSPVQPGKDDAMRRDWRRLLMCEAVMRLQFEGAPEAIKDLSPHEAKNWAATKKSTIAHAERLHSHFGRNDAIVGGILREAIADAKGAPRPKKTPDRSLS